MIAVTLQAFSKLYCPILGQLSHNDTHRHIMAAVADRREGLSVGRYHHLQGSLSGSTTYTLPFGYQ
jgi:hypothetical protein